MAISKRVPAGKNIVHLSEFSHQRLELIHVTREGAFVDLGYARVDINRHQRQGFPEAVYCPGKTRSQILKILEALVRGGGPVLATRAEPSVARAIRKRFPHAWYNARARLVIVKSASIPSPRSPFIIVMSAGTADVPIAEEAACTAETLGHPVRRIFDVGVAGIHRLMRYRNELEHANVIVVCAGMEGALPSVVGGLVSCPVIAVPTSIGYGVSMQGLAPLLTMLNSCAANVAVVNIDNGFGAGVLAGLIDQKRTSPIATRVGRDKR